MAISDSDFDFVRTLVCDQAGIVLETGKQYLVESRLGPLARRQGFASLDALVARLRLPAGADLRRSVIEAMTTNETLFFRDVEPFEALRTHVLPEMIAARAATRELSIWCGAASTGQEPYSVAMLLAEHFPQLAAGWTVRHVATDLNVEVLARARAGRYSQLEVNRGLPVTYLIKYFEKQGLEWQLAPAIRQSVEFRPMNLVKPWPPMPAFDIIMLRNVMIYFDVEAKRQILRQLRRLLRPDGYLFLGAAETTMQLDDQFERVQFDRAGCYRQVRARTGVA